MDDDLHFRVDVIASVVECFELGFRELAGPSDEGDRKRFTDDVRRLMDEVGAEVRQSHPDVSDRELDAALGWALGRRIDERSRRGRE